MSPKRIVTYMQLTSNTELEQAKIAEITNLKEHNALVARGFEEESTYCTSSPTS